MFELNDMHLITEDGTVSFEKKIMMAVELEKVVIVRLKIEVDDDDINNVFAVKGGEVIWQIQDATEYNRHFKRVDKFYSMVRVYEEDPRFLIATTNGGFRFVIDPLTGRIIDQESEVR